VLPRPHVAPDMTAGRSDDDAADDLAGFHGAERVVDLVELDLARHHRRRVEAAGLDEVDEALEVAAGGKEKAGSFTLGACTGLSVCPG